MQHSRRYKQAERVLTGQHLDDIRERMRRERARKKMLRSVHFWAMQFVGLILGIVGAVAYIAVIAILCGF